jgi:hypothetical protein
MNESWPVLNTSMLRPNGKGKDEVSADDINKLLKGRSFEQAPLSHQEIPEYNKEDILALEQFCKDNGILGVNFGRMNPRAALNMLKGKMGYKEQFSPKKEVLHG